MYRYRCTIFFPLKAFMFFAIIMNIIQDAAGIRGNKEEDQND